jgi:hypothetical protein
MGDAAKSGNEGFGRKHGMEGISKSAPSRVNNGKRKELNEMMTEDDDTIPVATHVPSDSSNDY